MRDTIPFRAIACAALAAALLAGCGKDEPRATSPRAPATSTPAQTPTAAPPGVIAALPDFSALVERNGPGVVNISALGMARDPYDDDPMGRFFRRRQVPPPEALVRGMGSGFIISPDGVVLTNAHVVENASVVVVRLTDKREFRAKVVGTDEGSDIAVLKIDADDLPYVPLGDPRAVKVGEWVLAIGSPYGFENTVTAGIVSAKSRSLSSDSYVPFLQTDVAVNPGNSGGPLFNLRGEVIGINSQIYSTTGGFMGLSFAIPIDMAVKVKDELIKHGRVRRARLGVAVQDVTPDVAESLRMDKAIGALVTAVERGGPADRAGMAPGDVILGVEDTDIVDFGDLPTKVAELRPGSRTKVRVWRRGAERELDVTVGEAKAR